MPTASIAVRGPRTLDEIAAEKQALIMADPFNPAVSAKITTLTREYAAVLLALPLNSKADGLIVYTGGWSLERAAEADAVGQPGTDAWYAALGSHQHATLTSDGRDAVRTAWCQGCPGADQWVRYEHWTTEGCHAHGFVCASCRRITQTG